MRLLNGRLYQQKAVYWSCTGQTDNFGKLVYNDPIVTICRWEDRTQIFLDKTGNQKTSRSIVYVPLIPVDESFLWLSSYKKKDPDSLVLSELANLIAGQGGVATLSTPHKILGAWRIQRIDQIPTLSARQTLRIAYL